jgi:hypothetical protein
VSVRRRAIAARQQRDADFYASWSNQTALLELLHEICTDALADRAAHLRLDDDGAPPIGETPSDAWLDLVAETIRLNS